MAEVKKDSIAVKNTGIRNYLLHKNLGKYSLYDELLTPAIGDIYETESRTLKSMTEGNGLLYHTHESSSEYAKDINWAYLNGEYDVDAAFSNNDNKLLRNRFSASGNDYRKFIYEVYGHEDVPIRFMNGLLAHESIEHALRLNETAIVENISPLESMAGVVKTNINNFSGTDTPLGLLSNQLYANALYNGADFNTARIIANETKVITPIAFKWYGNNSQNMNKLPFLFTRNEETGRIATDFSNETSISHNYGDIKNLNIRYLDEVLRNYNNKYGLWENEGYVKIIEGESDNPDYYSHLFIEGDFGDEESIINTTYTSNGRINDRNERIVFGDKDDSQQSAPDMLEQNKEDNEFESFRGIREDLNENSLLYKTNELFKANKIRTMHGRFYNNRDNEGLDNSEPTFIDTAKNGIWGNSHGRNLVRRNGAEKINGFEDPYCRVWTYHHQYDTYNKLIRPFDEKDRDAVYEANKPYRAKYETTNSDVTDGNTFLREHTVLRKDTGLVNITPERFGDSVDLKHCMFSIENLAWKDVPRNERYLSKEQQGPNGGRIMWFPPYGLDFRESVNTNYQEYNFIGRGEPTYTYTNTRRDGNLSFILLIDHPSVINSLHNVGGNINVADYGDGGNDDDHDGNILRFFAGCEPLKYKKKVDKPVKQDKPVTDTTKEPQYGHEYIYVFFPNNYSGNYNVQEFSNDSISQKLRNERGNLSKFAKGIEDEIKTSHGEYLCTDDDSFYKYLLYGKNISVDTTLEYDLGSTDGTKIFGYEMVAGSMENLINGSTNDYKKKPIPTGVCGVSYTENISGASKSDNDKNLCIRPCSNTTDFMACSKEDTSKDNSWNFYYRIDYDLHERIPYSSNRDLASYGLNSKLENVKGLKASEYIQGVDFSDATASFAELCCALKDANMMNENVNSNEKWYEYSKKCGAKKENIERLSRLFSITDTITELKFLGCATKQNSPTSNMLAIRRELALKGLFTKLLSQLSTNYKEETPKVTIETGFTTSSFNLINDRLMGANSCLAAKMGKFARIEIKYRLDKLNGNVATANSSENDEEKAIEDLFNKLKENSELISNFSEKKSDCYNIFREWFLSMAKSDGDIDGSDKKGEIVRQFISKNWVDNKWNENPTF